MDKQADGKQRNHHVFLEGRSCILRMVVVRDDDLLCLTHGSTEQELDKAHPPWTSAANCRPPRAARRHGPPVLASSCLVVLDRAHRRGRGDGPPDSFQRGLPLPAHNRAMKMSEVAARLPDGVRAFFSRPTHGRWPWVAAALAIPSTLGLIAGSGRLKEDSRWALWAPIPVLFWHQTEEWVIPGGFLPYVNRRAIGSSEDEYPLTRRLGLFINVGPGWGLNIAAATLGMRVPLLGTTALAMLMGNVALHGLMGIRFR